MTILAGKVALVTGGTKGIGRGIAIELASARASVVVTGRSVDLGTAVAQEINDSGGSALFVPADLAVESDVKRSVDAAVSEFGGLDILVNNAAPIQDMFEGHDKPLHDLPTASLERIVAVGIFGTAWYLKYAIQIMKLGPGGSIVNISAVPSLIGLKGEPGYTMIKGAMNSLTRQIAVEYAEDNIRCNAIAVGIVRGSAATDYLLDHPLVGPQMRSLLLTRPGEAADIAKLTRFLASDEAAYMSGSIVVMDGGTHAKAYLPDISEAFAEAH